MHNHEEAERHPTPESIERGYEQTDLNARAIVTFMAILGVVVGLVGVTMLGLHFVLGKEALQSEAPRSPLALDQQLAPEPRLQALPSVDLKQMREHDAAVLNSYGWVSREAQVIRLPVERAMELTVQRGLPLFPITPATEAQAGSSIGVPAAVEPAPAAPAPPVAVEPAPAPAVPMETPPATAPPAGAVQ